MQENSPIKKRILQYIDFKGISKYDFYKKSGITRGILDQNNGISEDNLTRFLAYDAKINTDWLLLGDGEMIKNEDFEDNPLTLNEPTTVYRLRTDKTLQAQSIPLYNTQAAAGLTQMFSDPPNVIDHISIPNLPKCDGAIYITGDSMYPLLKSGDIVAYKKINDIANGILWGEMYLLSFLMDSEDFTTVKYVQKSDKGDDHVKLVSQNQHHQPKDILLKNITALALIKASIRFNSMN